MSIKIKPSPSATHFIPGRRNKFRVSCKADRTLDGITFASKLERNVYARFKEAGLVFTLQPRYILQPKFEHAGKKYRGIAYVGDFLVQLPDGSTLLVDAKGMETDVFKLKEKLLAFTHHITIIKLRGKKDTESFIQQVSALTPPRPL